MADMLKRKHLHQKLLFVSLSVSLQACVGKSLPVAPTSTTLLQTPTIPLQIRKPPMLSICSPTFSSTLTIEPDAWRRKLIDGSSPALPVSQHDNP
ncbi:MAG TPA: hypothetical protein VMR43_02625 [Variovorax sp.]|nr:hypothetical protein [Variovorax sp.]